MKLSLSSLCLALTLLAFIKKLPAAAARIQGGGDSAVLDKHIILPNIQEAKPEPQPRRLSLSKFLRSLGRWGRGKVSTPKTAPRNTAPGNRGAPGSTGLKQDAADIAENMADIPDIPDISADSGCTFVDGMMNYYFTAATLVVAFIL